MKWALSTYCVGKFILRKTKLEWSGNEKIWLVLWAHHEKVNKLMEARKLKKDQSSVASRTVQGSYKLSVTFGWRQNADDKHWSSQSSKGREVLIDLTCSSHTDGNIIGPARMSFLYEPRCARSILRVLPRRTSGQYSPVQRLVSGSCTSYCIFQVWTLLLTTTIFSSLISEPKLVEIKSRSRYSGLRSSEISGYLQKIFPADVYYCPQNHERTEHLDKTKQCIEN